MNFRPHWRGHLSIQYVKLVILILSQCMSMGICKHQNYEVGGSQNCLIINQEFKMATQPVIGMKTSRNPNV